MFNLPLLDKATLIAGMKRQDHPNYQNCQNLACNGAGIKDTWSDQCKEIPWYQFGYDWDFENVVLAPRYGQTQVSAAVGDNATFVTFFLGGNEFLQCILKYGTVLAIANLGPYEPLGSESPMSLEQFFYEYETAIRALWASNRGICVGTFPTLEHIAAVLDKEELTGIIGVNPLPEGYYTNEIIMAAIIRGWLPSWNRELLTDDRNHYTPAEYQVINDAVIGFNSIIRSIAADPNHPCAVADVEGLISDMSAGNVHVNGWRINDKYTINNLGRPCASVYSSDGVHPSDIGHGLIAQTFIRAINSYYNTNIPELTEAELTDILNGDRFADNDGDGRIEGLSADAFYYCVNWYLGDSYTGDSGEQPRSAKILTIEYTNGGIGLVSTDKPGPEYFEGTAVQLTGLSNDKKRFDHWEGDVPGGYSTDNPITVTMDSNKQIVAVYSCASNAVAPLMLTAALMVGFLIVRRCRRSV